MECGGVMHRKLIGLLICLSTALPAWASSIVQSPSPVYQSTGTLSVSTGSNVTSGNFLLFLLICNNTPTITSVASDGTDTFKPNNTTDANSTIYTSGNAAMVAFTDTASSTRAETVSVVFSNTAYCVGQLYEISSVARFAVLQTYVISGSSIPYTTGISYINPSITNGVFIGCIKGSYLAPSNSGLTSFNTASGGGVNYTGCGYTSVSSITAAAPFTTTYTFSGSQNASAFGFLVSDAPAGGSTTILKPSTY